MNEVIKISQTTSTTRVFCCGNQVVNSTCWATQLKKIMQNKYNNKLKNT